jgi:hypothetical protein
VVDIGSEGEGEGEETAKEREKARGKERGGGRERDGRTSAVSEDEMGCTKHHTVLELTIRRS